jgi:chromosome segregation ATPase
LGLSDKAVQATIMAEIGEMLNDKQAFPKGSPQYKALDQFRKELLGLFGSGAGAASPAAAAVKEEDKSTAVSVPKQKNSSAKATKRVGYGATKRQSRDISTELDQVNTFQKAVNAKLAELKQQLAVVQQLHQQIESGAEVDEEYDEAREKYEADKQAYNAMQAKYLAALSQYNEHKKAYNATLSQYNAQR